MALRPVPTHKPTALLRNAFLLLNELSVSTTLLVSLAQFFVPATRTWKYQWLSCRMGSTSLTKRLSVSRASSVCQRSHAAYLSFHIFLCPPQSIVRIYASLIPEFHWSFLNVSIYMVKLAAVETLRTSWKEDTSKYSRENSRMTSH